MLSSWLRADRGSALAIALWLLGCGGSTPASDVAVGGGGLGAGTGGSGAATDSAGANAAGQSTSGGAAGAGGTNASAAAGALSAGGGASGAAAMACPSTGTQSDPGAVGDGKTTIDAPYTPAPETLTHLNGAPVGKVNGMAVGSTSLVPLVYAAKELYPGESQLLKYEYWIYVPAQYKPGCAAALMVFQDGLHFVGIDDAKLNAPTVLDNLIASGDMPVTIALLINPGEPGDGHYDGQEVPIRSIQYDTNSDAYVSFLVDEFLPANVLGAYDIVTDPDGWGIGGHSSGGIAAFMAGWYRPDKFRKLLTFDASFPNTHDNMGVSLLDSINASAVKPIRTYLMSGPNDLGGWYTANTTAASELAAQGYHYQYKVETSTHYPPLAAQQDFPNALRWMWRGYAL
jgi:enterochelin esterase-like enzyme